MTLANNPNSIIVELPKVEVERMQNMVICRKRNSCLHIKCKHYYLHEPIPIKKGRRGRCDWVIRLCLKNNEMVDCERLKIKEH